MTILIWPKIQICTTNFCQYSTQLYFGMRTHYNLSIGHALIYASSWKGFAIF